MKHKFKIIDNAILIILTLVYVSLCAVLANLIDIDWDFKQRLLENLYGLSFLASILLWLILIIGFLHFDGSKNTWWSKLLYEMYPYKDRRQSGTLLHDVLFPTLAWCICFITLIPLTLILIPLAIGGISYFILLNPIIFAWNRNLLVFILLLLLLTIAIVLILIHNHEIKSEKLYYKYISVIRTIFCIDVYFIGVLILLIGLAEGYYDICESIQKIKSDDNQFYNYLVVINKPLINILPGALILYFYRRNLNFLLYAENSYYLYLRSFQFDKKDDFLLNLLPVGKKQIMKIGNPSGGLLPKFLGEKNIYHDVLYLPSTNWRKHLDYYIYKAFSIICVIDDTPGVVWEMFHHPEYYHKLVFFVDSNEKLEKLEIMVKESDEIDFSPLLYKCIHYLNEAEMCVPFVFWIKDNKCYFDNNIHIISTLLSERLNVETSNFFELDMSINTIVNDTIIECPTEYKKWDIFSYFAFFIRQASGLVSSKLPLMLFFVIMTVALLFCLALLVSIIGSGIDLIINEENIIEGIIFIVIGSILTVSYILMLYNELLKKK